MNEIIRSPLDHKIQKYSRRSGNPIVADIAGMSRMEYVVGASHAYWPYIHENNHMEAMGWEDVESMAQFLQKLEDMEPEDKEKALYTILLKPYDL